jgi:predicted nucleotidyltransferase
MEKAREITGADIVVAVMSGDYVQRGEPALVDKYTRARMALSEGADMVFELPVRYALSSAEDFAYGGILALQSLSFVDFFCFGSEGAPADILEEASAFFADEPEKYRLLLGEFLKQGMSYPAAREHAFAQCTGMKANEQKMLFTPNNILGLEYMKAAKQLGTTMKPVAVERVGMGYHEVLNDGKNAKTVAKGSGENEEFLSAAEIRRRILGGSFFDDARQNDKAPHDAPRQNDETFHDAPQQNGETFHDAPQNGMSLSCIQQLKQADCYLQTEDFWQICSYAIREKWENLERVKDMSEELANAFRKNWYSAVSFEDFSGRCKTKNTTMARIKRCMFQTLLGIEKQDERENTLPYIRLLGMRERASALLREIQDTVVLTSLAKDMKNLDEEAQRLLHQDIKASDIYHSVQMGKTGKANSNEYTRSFLYNKNIRNSKKEG